MRTTPSLIILAVLAICDQGVAHAQIQDQLSGSVRSSLRSFLTNSNPTIFHGVSSVATLYLSSAIQNAKTEEDFKDLMIASRILYCQKVLEDLTNSSPNYSQVKTDFELELKNDLTSLKKATE